LVEVFVRLYEIDDDDEAADQPLECLGALDSLLKGLKHQAPIIAQLEVVLLPMLHRALEADGIGYLENILSIITFLTFYQEQISPQLWTLFPKICALATETALDYIEYMVPPLDNYISKGTAVFLSPETPYLEMIFNVYKKAVGDPNVAEIEAGEASQLFESILHNCYGRIEPRVDAILPLALEIAVGRLINACKTSAVKVLFLELVADALLYNPYLTLQFLESKGLVPSVFTLWLQTIRKFKYYFDQKIVLLGLSSVFSVRYEALPPGIKQGLKQIIETLLKLLEKTEEYRKEQELEKQDEPAKSEDTGAESESAAENDDDGVNFVEVADDQDVELVDDDQELLALSYVKDLRKMDDDFVSDDDDEVEEIVDLGEESRSGEGSSDGSDDGLEDEGDYIAEDSDEEEEIFTTAIDNVDELIFFATKLKQAGDIDPQAYQGLVNSLPLGDQQKIQEYFTTAQTRAVAAANAPQNNNKK